jgi:hypothetical protein
MIKSNPLKYDEIIIPELSPNKQINGIEKILYPSGRP